MTTTNTAEFFGARLRELMSECQVRNVETGKISKLTPLGLHRLIRLACPDAKISQSQLYRYVRGECAPRLDDLVVIAAVFRVSPHVFVPANAAVKALSA